MTKPQNEPLTAAEAKLVDDLAAQAGLVLRNVRLIEDLRASRQRLVTAQDEERRRLERNIHDGAQQQLVAIAVKANLAGSLVGKDPQQERAILDQLKAEATEALENLRDLARGIYPPLLADQGLAAALQAHARKSPIPVEVRPTESGATGRRPRRPCTSVSWRDCRTSPSTRRPPGRWFVCVTGTDSCRSKWQMTARASMPAARPMGPGFKGSRTASRRLTERSKCALPRVREQRSWEQSRFGPTRRPQR